MFNKIMKRGQRKPSKSSEAIEAPIPTAAPPNVIVNHASRMAAATAQPASLATVPQNTGVVEVLPMLKDVPLAERHVIFIRKAQVCCVSFDFSDTMKSAREKEIKRQTLSELVELVQSGSCKMNEIMQEELVKMISLNIFRSLPPASHENTGSEGGDPEEDEIYMDPTWPHLQLVYELLLRYIVSSDTDTKVAKRFIFETERFSGIGELLEILGSVINGFALPMKEEHKLFLVRALIPLHKPKCVSTYHQHLSYCVTQFVEKDYRLADIVIKGVLKYWPVTSCGKEVLFLGELEEILEVTQPVEFQRCMVPLFKQIGRSLRSSHFQVAERALFWWNNEHIVGLIADNRHVILPIIFDALEHNIHRHWNQAINGLSYNVRRMFLEMDTELFDECQRRHEEKEAKAGGLEKRRLLTWKRLEEVADQANG